MTTYGLTAAGFVIKPFAQIVAEITAVYRAQYGANVPVDPSSRNGQTIGIFAERENSVWELLQLLYSAFDPDMATGDALDALCAITGAKRAAASKSNVTLTLTGTPGVHAVTASVAGSSHSIKFQTQTGELLVTIANWAAITAQAPGDRKTHVGNIYQVVAGGGGTTAASGGPTGTGSAIVDGTVTWMFVGVGTAAVDIYAVATDSGPLAGPAGTITVIETPSAGLQGVFNVLDASLGTSLQLDNSLRITRMQQLQSAGKSPLGSILSALINVSGVSAVAVFENQTDSTDANSVPPHSIDAVVVGGANQAIWNAIFASAAGGINKDYGNTAGSVTDSQGNPHPVAFDRPANVPIYVTVNALVDPANFPLDGAARILANVLAYGLTLKMDYDIFARQIESAILLGVPSAGLLGVPGVLDPGILVSTAPTPTLPNTIPINCRQIGAFSSGNTVVNVTNGIP